MNKDDINENYASIVIKIWNNKDCNGLYKYQYSNNYENEYIEKYIIFDKNGRNCHLIKDKNNSIKKKEQKDCKENDDILFRIRCGLKNNTYEAMKPIFEHKIFKRDYNSDNILDDKIWFSVKSQSFLEGNKQNYNLNENDIIKLGKKMYIINKLHFVKEENIKDENFYEDNDISYISLLNKKSKSIFNIDLQKSQYKIKRNNNDDIISSIESSQNNNKKNNYQSSQFSTEDKSKKVQNENESDSDNDYDSGNNICRSCLNSFSNINNPLVCLCNCHNYIHFECLKKYLNSKLTVKEYSKEKVKTLLYIKFNCEICFKPYYLLRFRIPEFNKTYELIDLDLPEETDYFYLESLNYINNDNDNDNDNIKIMHIVKLNDEEINIGRSFYNDILDNDSSVSMNHAVFKYNKNNRTLFLEDKKGRYGTLVLVRGNIKVSEEKTFFQILNTHISMELINKINSKKIGKDNDY